MGCRGTVDFEWLVFPETELDFVVTFLEKEVNEIKLVNVFHSL